MEEKQLEMCRQFFEADTERCLFSYGAYQVLFNAYQHSFGQLWYMRMRVGYEEISTALKAIRHHVGHDGHGHDGVKKHPKPDNTSKQKSGYFLNSGSDE